MTNITKWFLLISLLLVTAANKKYFAYKPGLPIPTWYKAKLTPVTTPELEKPFKLHFELHNLLGDLHNIELQLKLPRGVKIIKGRMSQSKKVLKKTNSQNWHWELMIERELLGESIELKVSSKFPKAEITRAALGQYNEEPHHQRDQLTKKIANINDRVDLYFQTTIYCTKMEGFAKVPDLIFRHSWKPKNFSSPFIMYHYKDPKLKKKDKILQKIKEFEKYHSDISKNKNVIDKFQTLRPMTFKRMLEDNFYRYYALAIGAFDEGDFSGCDKWLQKLSLLILSQENLNSQLFLAIQNTRALCNVALNKFSEARKILKSSVQTEVNASIRHYLFYNIAVIFEQENNKAQMSHNLIQALSLNPSFSSAKNLLKKYQ
tara:strand:+ start:2740 stop:3864 length:1125 start_codon:yes stop_codon:yes gene_type:complete